MAGGVWSTQHEELGIEQCLKRTVIAYRRPERPTWRTTRTPHPAAETTKALRDADPRSSGHEAQVRLGDHSHCPHVPLGAVKLEGVASQVWGQSRQGPWNHAPL